MSVPSSLPPPQKTRRQVEETIGPVRHVYGPLWMYRIGVYFGILPVYFLAFLVLVLVIFCGLQFSGIVSPVREGVGMMILPILFLGGITAFGFSMLWRRWRLLGSRLILGEGGMAEWTPYDTKIVTADTLGTEWIWCPLGPNNDGLPYAVHLALHHLPTGRHLYITSFYQNAASVGKLLREKLADKARMERWADLSRWRPDPALERAANSANRQGIRPSSPNLHPGSNES